ncbi:MAG: hypothetical protein KDD35_05970, partial [Bdellovibrionales bacterium]|nr:hypothetical protein [Bdellovibrionales bacterium]
MAEQWKEFDKINLSFIFKKETPFFLYDFPKLEENLRFLRKFFHQLVDCETKLYYSSKCNPNHVLLSFLAERVDGFDCSSEIEILMMNGLRVSANRISISGPGKTDEVLALASREATGCLHLDSVDEYESLIEWRRGHHIHSQTPPLSLRLQLESEGSKLGMTEHEVSELLSKARPGEFAGLHTYLGREMFSFERFTQHLRTLEQLIARFQSAFVSEVKIFLGPGLPSMKALRNMELPKIPLKCSHPIVFEIGRSLVADAGYYAAPILTKKETRHPTIIVNGGVHHLGSPLVS